MFSTTRVRVTMSMGLALATFWGRPVTPSSDQEIRLRDDCDPVTFNEGRPQPICVGNGDTTLNRFRDELAEEHSVGSWRIKPDDTHIDAGEDLVLVNRGGETHTFTRVRAFGGGFVAGLNAASNNDTPAPECAKVAADGSLTPQPPSATNLFVPAGEHINNVKVSGSGVARFQCCIHPWMRTTIVVRGRGRGGRD